YSREEATKLRFRACPKAPSADRAPARGTRPLGSCVPPHQSKSREITERGHGITESASRRERASMSGGSARPAPRPGVATTGRTGRVGSARPNAPRQRSVPLCGGRFAINRPSRAPDKVLIPPTNRDPLGVEVLEERLGELSRRSEPVPQLRDRD